jgi:hypothetical protein
MGTVIFLVVIVGILAIVVIDGTAIFFASQAADDVSQEAANLALRDFEINHDDIRAENLAADYCEGKGLVFIRFKVNREGARSYDVTCGKDARTFVFKYLPFFKEQLHHESTATSSGI